MMKINITNDDNSKLSVDLVRYFKFKTDCYLIYTLGEVDEKNYKKLYLVRIMEELGFPVVQTIRNDADWANMQGIVKKVLKELKKNKKSQTEDLDPKEINGIKVVEPRFFKLEASLVDILSSNYMYDENSLTVNMDNTILNNEQGDVLEPIDQTIIRENNDVSLVEENVGLANGENNSQIDPIVPPVAPLPDYNEDNRLNMVNEIKTSNIEIHPQSALNPIDMMQPIIEEQKNDIINDSNLSPSNELNSITNNVEVDNKINNASSDNIEIDYKELYDSLKQDNDATNELLNTLMVELGKYKEKYGELDINA